MKNTNKNMLYTFCAFRSSCSVHSSVSAADYNYIFANIQLTIICLEITKKLQSVNGLTFFQFQSARLASSNCQDHSIIALCFQICHRSDFCICADLYTHLLDERNIFVNSSVSNTESRYHVTDHTAGFLFFFKNGNCCALSCKEVSSCNTCRTATNYGDLLTVWLASLDLTDQLLIAMLCCCQLGATDIYGFFVEITGTFGHTVVCT